MTLNLRHLLKLNIIMLKYHEYIIIGDVQRVRPPSYIFFKFYSK